MKIGRKMLVMTSIVPSFLNHNVVSWIACIHVHTISLGCNT